MVSASILTKKKHLKTLYRSQMLGIKALIEEKIKDPAFKARIEKAIKNQQRN